MHDRAASCLRRQQDKIRFVLVHHEEAAAFMADRLREGDRKIGMCLATSARAASTCSTACYDA